MAAESHRESRTKRVLIVRVGAMGDVLHALPAVAALRQLHPECFIGWAIEPRWLPLLQAGVGGDGHERGPASPIVDRVYLAATKQWKRQPIRRTLDQIARLRRELRDESFDHCVDMQGSIRSAAIGRLAGAGVLAGPADPREGPAAWLYGTRIRTTASHVVEQGCEVLGGALGLSLRPARVTLPVDARAEARCEEALARIGRRDEGFVLLAPQAGWGAKQWPADRYGEVAARLARQGVRVIVNSTSPNDPTAQAVVAVSGDRASVISCDIAELVALTRRAALVIAGDTGPLHLAAALERPVVALFGPTDPKRNGPYGTRAAVLRHGAERRDHRRLEAPEAGLLEISVDEVVEAALRMLHHDIDAIR